MGGYLSCCTSKNTGNLAMIPLIVSFPFANRNSMWTFLLGIPYERGIFWHSYLSALSFFIGVYHGLISKYSASGAGFIITFAMLMTVSVGEIRKNFFETFLKLHWIFFFLFIVFSIVHKAYFVLIGIFFIIFDVIVRLVIILQNKKILKNVSLIQLPADIVRISFPKNNFLYKSGQYVFLCFPEISRFEWHPFSISSSPYMEEIQLHARVLGNWTKELYEIAKTKEHPCYIEGPYGTPYVDIDKDYKIFLFISGGIGVTPMQSICNDLVNSYKEGRNIEKIYFIWTIRDKFLINYNLDYNIEYSEKNLPTRLPVSFQPDILIPNPKILEERYYMTHIRLEEEFEEGNIDPLNQPNLKFGRPNFEKTFEEIQQFANLKGIKKIAVLCCGPKPMSKEIHYYCKKFSRQKIIFDYHNEEFNL